MADSIVFFWQVVRCCHFCRCVNTISKLTVRVWPCGFRMVLASAGVLGVLKRSQTSLNTWSGSKLVRIVSFCISFLDQIKIQGDILNIQCLISTCSVQSLPAFAELLHRRDSAVASSPPTRGCCERAGPSALFATHATWGAILSSQDAASARGDQQWQLQRTPGMVHLARIHHQCPTRCLMSWCRCGNFHLCCFNMRNNWKVTRGWIARPES